MKRKSIIVKIVIMMFVTLAVSFTVANVISCKLWEAQMAIALGVPIEEARQGLSGTVARLTAISSAMGIIVLVILVVFLSKVLLKPLKIGATEIQRVAEYDLRDNSQTEIIRKYAGRNDEIGMIAESIITMHRNLKNIVEQISTISEQVNSSAAVLGNETGRVSEISSEISNAINGISIGATNQAADMETGLGEVETLDQCITSNINDTNELQGNADAMDAIKDEGLVALKGLVEKTAESNESLTVVKSTIDEMAVQTQKIVDATELINSISSQTNLLSLNASIEAARAGDAGRGFAVVADEIGKLADETNNLTKQIAEIVAGLTEKVRKTGADMNAMENSLKEQNESVKITEEKFYAIEARLRDVKQSVNVIFKSSEEMRDNKDSLVSMFGKLSETAEENAASSEEVRASVELQVNAVEQLSNMSSELVRIADELKTEASYFHL